jgi:hypothetical protein
MATVDEADPNRPWNVVLDVAATEDVVWMAFHGCGLNAPGSDAYGTPTMFGVKDGTTYASLPSTIAVYPQYYGADLDPDGCFVQWGSASNEWSQVRFFPTLPDPVRDACPIWQKNYSAESQQFHQVRFLEGTTITGTDGRDDFCVFAADAIVDVTAGNDTVALMSGASNATVQLGDGLDRLYTWAPGPLSVYGEGDDDQISPMPGSPLYPTEEETAGVSAALTYAPLGTDVLLDGGRGTDRITTVRTGHSVARGGRGDDMLKATVRTAQVSGGRGHDVCRVLRAIKTYGFLAGCEDVRFI